MDDSDSRPVSPPPAADAVPLLLVSPSFRRTTSRISLSRLLIRSILSCSRLTRFLADCSLTVYGEKRVAECRCRALNEASKAASVSMLEASWD